MLTKHEMAQVCAFLDELRYHYRIASCNDMSLKDTPENRDMVEAAARQSLGEDFEGLKIKNGFIYTCDSFVLNFLQEKLMKEHNLTEDDIPVRH